MLLGHRVTQKSILWPLVAVMLPGWLLLVTLVRRPSSDFHTQLALHERLSRQLLAYEYADSLGDSSSEGRPSLPDRRAKIETLFNQAAEAGLIKEPQTTDQALVMHRFGEADRATQLLASVPPAEKGETYPPYFLLIQKTVQNQPLDDKDKASLRHLMDASPHDWWLNTIARAHHFDDSLQPEFASAQLLAWWCVRAASLLLPALGLLALCASPFALRILRGTWTVWPYSERIQRLWPLPLMLFALSLRGLLMLLGGKVGSMILPLISWAGQKDPLTVYHINVLLGFGFNIILLTATTLAVKEAVAPRCGNLSEVLGFDLTEFRSRRLWCLALPLAVALQYGLAPLPGLLDQWQIGGTSIFDGLSRSPGGYNLGCTLLSLAQAILWAPFFEEVIYRGFLLSALRNHFRPSLAIALSAAVFALAHGTSLTGTLTAFVHGAAYATLKLHTGRLSSAIVLHSSVAMIQMALALLNGG